MCLQLRQLSSRVFFPLGKLFCTKIQSSKPAGYLLQSTKTVKPNVFPPNPHHCLFTSQMRHQNEDMMPQLPESTASSLLLSPTSACPLHSITSSSHLLLPSAPLYPLSLTSFFLLSSLLYHTFPAQMSLQRLSNKGNKCVFINMKYILYSSSFFYAWP